MHTFHQEKVSKESHTSSWDFLKSSSILATRSFHAKKMKHFCNNINTNFRNIIHLLRYTWVYVLG